MQLVHVVSILAMISILLDWYVYAYSCNFKMMEIKKLYNIIFLCFILYVFVKM